MIGLGIVAVLFISLLVFLDIKPDRNAEREKEEQDRILANADILSRKARYEDKSFTTRIHNVLKRYFESYKTLDNLILMDENGIEHQIPLLCATNKGVILFQTVDYPGKGLFGNMHDEEWKIAQSAEIAQVVPNAALLAIENALLIKRLTGINVKPIAVVSKYTPSVAALDSHVMGQRVILEEDLPREMQDIASYGKQFYPDEFMLQVKQKLLAMNIADEEDEDEDEEVEEVDIPSTDESNDEDVSAPASV